jgi:hypothetical protein
MNIAHLHHHHTYAHRLTTTTALRRRRPQRPPDDRHTADEPAPARSGGTRRSGPPRAGAGRRACSGVPRLSVLPCVAPFPRAASARPPTQPQPAPTSNHIAPTSSMPAPAGRRPRGRSLRPSRPPLARAVRLRALPGPPAPRTPRAAPPGGGSPLSLRLQTWPRVRLGPPRLPLPPVACPSASPGNSKSGPQAVLRALGIFRPAFAAPRQHSAASPPIADRQAPVACGGVLSPFRVQRASRTTYPARATPARQAATATGGAPIGQAQRCPPDPPLGGSSPPAFGRPPVGGRSRGTPRAGPGKRPAGSTRHASCPVQHVSRHAGHPPAALRAARRPPLIWGAGRNAAAPPGRPGRLAPPPWPPQTPYVGGQGGGAHKGLTASRHTPIIPQ